MSPIASDTIHAPAQPTAVESLKAAAKAGQSHQSLEGLSDDPLDRTWRGNKEGTIKLLAKCPKFTDVYAEREWVKVSARRRVIGR